MTEMGEYLGYEYEVYYDAIGEDKKIQHTLTVYVDHQHYITMPKASGKWSISEIKQKIQKISDMMIPNSYKSVQ